MRAALEHLVRARLQGVKPTLVLLTLYAAKQPRWWRETHVLTEIVVDENLARADLRGLIGCDVLLATERLDDRAREVARQAIRYAASLVVCPLDGSEVLCWQRDTGWDAGKAREAA